MKFIFELSSKLRLRRKILPLLFSISFVPMLAREVRAASPPNDNFANRILISGEAVSITGFNTNATREAGEPIHGGRVGTTSVWWSWVAPYSGRVTINTFGSSFDTLLSVYVGSTLSALSTVASNDDVIGTNTSRVSFDCVAGLTYQIAVDGFIDETGSISLNLLLQPVLNITKFGSSVILSWTAASSGYGLETAAFIPNPVWSAVQPDPIITSGQFKVTNSIAAGTRFYRLKKL